MIPLYSPTTPTPPSIIILFVCIIFEAATNNSVSNPKCLDRNGTLATPGWTIPQGDIVVEVGTPLEIYCMLDSTNTLTQNYTARDIVFQKGGRKVDSQYVSVVNATAARLHMETLNSSVGTEYVYCNLNLRGKDVATFILSANTSSLEIPSTAVQMICSNAVTIGCKPQKVQNLTCYNRDLDQLVCTWIEPNNGVQTDYFIFYMSTITPREGVPMYKVLVRPAQVHTMMICQLVEPGKCVGKEVAPRYTAVFVDANNTFGEGRQSQFFRGHEIIIPHPPVRLTALDSTPHSIHLSFSIRFIRYNWELRGRELPVDLFYKVNYTWNIPALWRSNEYHFNDSRREGNTVYINVTDMPYPNVDYDLRISMRAAFANSRWSESAFLRAKTSPSAPYRPPETDVGSFEILPHSHQSHSRDVQVYWKPIPDLEHNANNLKYEFAVFKDDVEVNVKPDVVEKMYARFKNLSSSSYRFAIRAINDMGSSPYTSEVKLPRGTDIFSEPTQLQRVDYEEGVYKLRWRAPNVTETNGRVVDYTVFWCEYDREDLHRCLSSVNWTHVSADTLQYKRTFNAKPLKFYQFGISANSMNSSSGIKWPSCTVLPNRIGKMTTTKISEVHSHNITLEWTLECDQRVEGIKGYNVTYCPKLGDTCAEPLKMYLIDGDDTTNNGTITGLTPFTKYKFSVSIFTDKLLGEPSEWQSIQTQEAAPNMTGIKVEVTNITNTSALVTWTAPSNPNGILDHYEVHYGGNKKVTDKTSVELTALRSYDTYHIQVVACTKVCSNGTDPVALRTEIGIPNEVRNISSEKLNDAVIKLKWDPPTLPAGPNPSFCVKIQFKQNDTIVDLNEFQTNKTEMVVETPCNREPHRSAYMISVRARNIENSDLNETKRYDGPWSAPYTIDCVSSAELSTMWKIIIIIMVSILSLVGCALCSNEGFRKWKKTTTVEIKLPAQFTIPQPRPNEITNAAYHVNIQLSENPSEIDEINKLSDANQNSVDSIDLELDPDRETSHLDLDLVRETSHLDLDLVRETSHLDLDPDRETNHLDLDPDRETNQMDLDPDRETNQLDLDPDGETS